MTTRKLPNLLETPAAAEMFAHFDTVLEQIEAGEEFDAVPAAIAAWNSGYGLDARDGLAGRRNAVLEAAGLIAFPPVSSDSPVRAWQPTPEGLALGMVKR